MIGGPKNSKGTFILFCPTLLKDGAPNPLKNLGTHEREEGGERVKVGIHRFIRSCGKSNHFPLLLKGFIFYFNYFFPTFSKARENLP